MSQCQLLTAVSYPLPLPPPAQDCGTTALTNDIYHTQDSVPSRGKARPQRTKTAQASELNHWHGTDAEGTG